MPLTSEQRTARQRFLGGTDLAALAGVSPWASPIDVFYDKRPDLLPGGEPGPDQPSTMMSMGHLLEPVVADLFHAAQPQIALRRHSRPVRCRDHPWEGGHLDRTASDGGIFEAKWSMKADQWSVPGELPLRIPPQYMVQVQWYLHVTRAPHAWVAVLLGYADFRAYQLMPDLMLHETLVELARRFWFEHVEPGVPPPPDGTEQYSRALRRRYDRDDGTTAVATLAQRRLLAQIKDVRNRLAQAIAEDRRLTQELQLQMGTTTVLDAPGARVIWRRTAERLVVEWEALATALLADIVEEQGQPWPATKKAQAEEVRAHARHLGLAHEEPGTRPFKVTFEDEEPGDA